MRARTGREVLGWTAVAVMVALLVIQLVGVVRHEEEIQQLEREIDRKQHSVDSLQRVLGEVLCDTTSWGAP